MESNNLNYPNVDNDSDCSKEGDLNNTNIFVHYIKYKIYVMHKIYFKLLNYN